MEEAPSDRCRYFEGLFSPYIEGELDSPERRALAEHLHDCEVCSRTFGARWRQAASRLVEGGMPRRRRSTRTGGWFLVAGCLLGVALLAAIGLLDMSEGRLPRSPGQNLVASELAEIVRVQNDLLKAVAEPLRGGPPSVSHAARGAARDFFEGLANGQPADRLHRLFRVHDSRPGGHDLEREAFLHDLSLAAPKIVLADVVCSLREVTLCRVRWGDRTALAWLLHEVAGEKAPPRTLLALMVIEG